MGTLITDLEAALGTEAEEDAETSRAEEAAEHGSWRQRRGGPRPAEQVVIAAHRVRPAGASWSLRRRGGSGDRPEPGQVAGQGDLRSRATQKPPKPPKGGATPSQVAKAKAQAAEDKAAFEKDKAQKARPRRPSPRPRRPMPRPRPPPPWRWPISRRQRCRTPRPPTRRRHAVRDDWLAALLPGTPTTSRWPPPHWPRGSRRPAGCGRCPAARRRWRPRVRRATVAEEQATLEALKPTPRRPKPSTRSPRRRWRSTGEPRRDSTGARRQGLLPAHRTVRETGGYWSSGVHTGLDFAGPVGHPDHGRRERQVVSTGYEGAYGNQIIIDHGDGYQTTYNHLSGIGVSAGDQVSTGDRSAGSDRPATRPGRTCTSRSPRTASSWTRGLVGLVGQAPRRSRVADVTAGQPARPRIGRDDAGTRDDCAVRRGGPDGRPVVVVRAMRIESANRPCAGRAYGRPARCWTTP